MQHKSPLEKFTERVNNLFAWWKLSYNNRNEGCQVVWGINCINLMPGVGQGSPIIFRKEENGNVGVWDFTGCETFDVPWETAWFIISDAEVEAKGE